MSTVRPNLKLVETQIQNEIYRQLLNNAPIRNTIWGQAWQNLGGVVAFGVWSQVAEVLDMRLRRGL